MAEKSLPTMEDPGLNPAIRNFYLAFIYSLEKKRNNEKEEGNGQF